MKALLVLLEFFCRRQSHYACELLWRSDHSTGHWSDRGKHAGYVLLTTSGCRTGVLGGAFPGGHDGGYLLSP